MEQQKLVETAMVLFALNGVKWSIGGELKTPTEDDITRVLDRLHQAVYDGEEQTQASTGGLLVKKEYGTVDTYIYIGEYDDSDTN